MHCKHCEDEFNKDTAKRIIAKSSLSEDDAWRDCLDCPFLNLCPGRCDKLLN